jgi:hypothetical protein
MEGIADRIAGVAPAEAIKARTRLYNTFANGLSSQIHGPRLEGADTIQRSIQALGPRAPQRSAELQRALDERRGKWESAVELAAPFKNLGEVFGNRVVRIENDALRRSPAEASASDIVLVPRVGCAGETQCDVQFSAGWRKASELGVEFRLGPQRGYSFLLSVNDRRDDRPPPKNARVKLFADVLSTKSPVYLQILHHGAPLRVQELTAADLVSDKLQIRARREGDLLSVQVNDGTPISFRDPFPVSVAGATLALVWPKMIAIDQLVAQRKLLPPKASPLEHGDSLYDQRRFKEALALYEQQLKGVTAEALT